METQVNISTLNGLAILVKVQHESGDITLYVLDYSAGSGFFGEIVEVSHGSVISRPTQPDDLLQLGKMLTASAWKPNWPMNAHENHIAPMTNSWNFAAHDLRPNA